MSDRADHARSAVLEYVAALRTRRAEIRRALQAGDLTLDHILFQMDDPLLAALKVKSVLTAVPSLGKIKTVRLLARLGISEFERIGALDADQRRQLVAAAGSVDG